MNNKEIAMAMQIDFYAANDHHARFMMVEMAHIKALEMDKDYLLAIATVADNLTSPVWDGLSETLRREVVKYHHAEALEINAAIDEVAQINRQYQYDSFELYQKVEAMNENDRFDRITESDRAAQIEKAHAEALGMDVQRDFYLSPACRRQLVEDAHTEALTIDAKKNAMRNASKASMEFIFCEGVKSYPDVWLALAAWDAMHDDALEQNAAFDRVAEQMASNRKHPAWKVQCKTLKAQAVSIAHDKALEVNANRDQHKTEWKGFKISELECVYRLQPIQHFSNGFALIVEAVK